MISITTKDHPVCLYAEAYEELHNWVASLLVAVSKGMNGIKYIIVTTLILYMQNFTILLNHLYEYKT